MGDHSILLPYPLLNTFCSITKSVISQYVYPIPKSVTTLLDTTFSSSATSQYILLYPPIGDFSIRLPFPQIGDRPSRYDFTYPKIGDYPAWYNVFFYLVWIPQSAASLLNRKFCFAPKSATTTTFCLSPNGRPKLIYLSVDYWSMTRVIVYYTFSWTGGSYFREYLLLTSFCNDQTVRSIWTV